MKAIYCFCSVLVVTFFACHEDESSHSPINGEWSITSYQRTEARVGEQSSTQTWNNVGIITFKEDGTGIVSLQIPLAGISQGPMTWTRTDASLTLDFTIDTDFPNMMTFSIDESYGCNLEVSFATYGNAIDTSTKLIISKAP